MPDPATPPAHLFDVQLELNERYARLARHQERLGAIHAEISREAAAITNLKLLAIKTIEASLPDGDTLSTDCGPFLFDGPDGTTWTIGPGGFCAATVRRSVDMPVPASALEANDDIDWWGVPADVRDDAAVEPSTMTETERADCLTPTGSAALDRTVGRLLSETVTFFPMPPDTPSVEPPDPYGGLIAGAGDTHPWLRSCGAGVKTILGLIEIGMTRASILRANVGLTEPDIDACVKWERRGANANNVAEAIR